MDCKFTKRIRKVLTSEEFGQAMALWRLQWEQEELEQRGMKRGRDAFYGFVHACLGHRTLSRAIIQFGITSRQQLIKALTDSLARNRRPRQAFNLGMSWPGSKFASDTAGADEAMPGSQRMSNKTQRAKNTQVSGKGSRHCLQ